MKARVKELRLQKKSMGCCGATCPITFRRANVEVDKAKEGEPLKGHLRATPAPQKGPGAREASRLVDLGSCRSTADTLNSAVAATQQSVPDRCTGSAAARRASLISPVLGKQSVECRGANLVHARPWNLRIADDRKMGRQLLFCPGPTARQTDSVRTGTR